LTDGLVQLNKQAFTEGVNAFSLWLKLEALTNPTNLRRSIVLRHVTGGDVGTFNAASLAQIIALNAAVEITGKLPDAVDTVRYYKIPLTPVEGTQLYTWLDCAGVGTAEIRATLILHEA
jgi:hypothetical protein